MDILSEDLAVLSGKINMFEDTVRWPDAPWTHEESVLEPLLIEADDFSRFDFTNELGPNSIKGTGFTGNDIAAFFRLAHGQGSDAVGVSSCRRGQMAAGERTLTRSRPSRLAS